MRRLAFAATITALLLAGSRLQGLRADESGPAWVPVTGVRTIGLTVADMDRSLKFYTSVLGFTKKTDVEVSGREYELLSGVFGVRLRIASLQLGDESIELTEYLAPKGQPFPSDMRPNDASFQHIAIIVSDMDRAYARLREFRVEHASTGPQRLPDWNPSASGIRAFYFRDPDRHFLEILHFPPGKGLDKWQRSERLFLGVDHTAIVTADTDRSLTFYRDLLQMRVAGESENSDTEQEHLNNVFGARLRITALRASQGPGVELLEYLAPRDGRPIPLDLRSNDIAHWQTTMVSDAVDRITRLFRLRVFSFVSPTVVTVPTPKLGFDRGILVRDPDGHAVRLVSAA